MKNGITAHIIVKNEEKWIWYSIMSIIDYVDKVIIFDTGSQDNTVAIIKEFEKYDKVIFYEKGEVTKEEFYKLRQLQIEMTETKWFFVLDGDEIWYKNDIIEIREKIFSKDFNYKMISSKFHNCVGDIYHHMDFLDEHYKIKGIVGSITIRFYSLEIDGIHCKGEYGVEGYYNKNNEPVQNDEESIYMHDGYYFHTSYLQRSSSIKFDWKIPYRRKKIFSKMKNKVNKDFKFPEVFYLEKRPLLVDTAFNKVKFFFIVKLFMLKVLRKIKIIKIEE